MCRREEKGKAVAHPQHTAIMVESDQATSSSAHCSSINSAGHSSTYRAPSGAAPVLIFDKDTVPGTVNSPLSMFQKESAGLLRQIKVAG